MFPLPMRETMANNNIINYLYNLKMNPTIYTQLFPLGFAEWIAKITEEDSPSDNKFIELDAEPIDSWVRTTLNALAFRWLREEKKIFVSYNQQPKSIGKIGFTYDMEVGEDIFMLDYYSSTKPTGTHELAEHEALNKALEILSKGGENGE